MVLGITPPRARLFLMSIMSDDMSVDQGGPAVDELALVAALADDLGVPVRPVRRVQHDGGPTPISALQWGGARPAIVLLHGGSLNAHALGRACSSSTPSSTPSPSTSPVTATRAGSTIPSTCLTTSPPPSPRRSAPWPRCRSCSSATQWVATPPSPSRSADPSSSQRLVLVDTTPGSTPDRSQDLVDFVSARDFPSLDALVDHVAAFKPHRSRESLQRSVLLNARPTDEGRWTWRHDGRDRVGVDRWTRTFEELPKGWDHAAVVQHPTLVIRGDRSEIMLPSDVERYRQLVGDLRVLELADAGHNIHGDQPLALGDAVAAFAHEGRDRS